MSSLIQSNVDPHTLHDWNRKPVFRVKKSLGKGTFGVVYLVLDDYGNKFALKRVKGSFEDNKKEVSILQNLNHPNCVSLLFYFETEDNENGSCFNMIFEYISSTSLWDAIYKSSIKMTLDRVVDIFYQLCLAVQHVHSKKIAHRDLKPSNVILREEDDYVMLIDFGSAKRLEPGRENALYCVSRFYRAPELLLNCTEYDISIDVWSMGCILWEIVVGRPLFKGKDCQDQILRIISVLGTPTKEDLRGMKVNEIDLEIDFLYVEPVLFTKVLPNEYSLVADLMQKMLVFNPSKRISIHETLKHPLFDQYLMQASMDVQII